jgi:hypothetical protein
MRKVLATLRDYAYDALIVVILSLVLAQILPD